MVLKHRRQIWLEMEVLIKCSYTKSLHTFDLARIAQLYAKHWIEVSHFEVSEVHMKCTTIRVYLRLGGHKKRRKFIAP